MPDTVGVNVKWAKSNFPVEIDPVRPPRRLDRAVPAKLWWR